MKLRELLHEFLILNIIERFMDHLIFYLEEIVIEEDGEAVQLHKSLNSDVVIVLSLIKLLVYKIFASSLIKTY